MKLSTLVKKSRLWARFIRLSMLAIPMVWVTTRGFQIRQKIRFGLGRKRANLMFSSLVRRQFLNKDFLNSKCIVVDYEDFRPISTSLDGLVAFAWICEKMKINVKIKIPNSMIWRHFENDTLINITNKSAHKFQSSTQKKFFGLQVAWFGAFFIPSAYGHKILSKLAINRYLKGCANQWLADNIKGDWVAVHYRGTDVAKGKNINHKQRYRIDLDPYITYLKGVISDQYSIFACSDQAQFIDKMRIAFPNRVFSRDIERSCNEHPLHRYGFLGQEIDSFNQEKDALIDLLILAKAKLIYTTGSGFIDVARYFNPQIKIISLDQRKIGRGENNVPIPRKDLYDKLCRSL